MLKETQITYQDDNGVSLMGHLVYDASHQQPRPVVLIAPDWSGCNDFAREMTDAGADWQVHLYGNNMHAFTNPMANDPKFGTVYNPVAEKCALLAMKNFFAELFV